jgi:hypothetical protein
VERLLLAAVLIVVAVIVAGVLQRLRGRSDAPTQSRWAVPTQLDRADFEGPDSPWLVAVFTSETCDSCVRARQKAAVLASSSVAVVDVPYQSRKDLHTRYAVDVVPMILVAGSDGVVAASFVGVPSATDLWAAVAEARAPGASPEPDLGRPNP